MTQCQQYVVVSSFFLNRLLQTVLQRACNTAKISYYHIYSDILYFIEMINITPPILLIISRIIIIYINAYFNF